MPVQVWGVGRQQLRGVWGPTGRNEGWALARAGWEPKLRRLAGDGHPRGGVGGRPALSLARGQRAAGPDVRGRRWRRRRAVARAGFPPFVRSASDRRRESPSAEQLRKPGVRARDPAQRARGEAGGGAGRTWRGRRRRAAARGGRGAGRRELASSLVPSARPVTTERRPFELGAGPQT